MGRRKPQHPPRVNHHDDDPVDAVQPPAATCEAVDSDGDALDGSTIHLTPGVFLSEFETDVAGLTFCGARRTARCEVLETHQGLTQQLLDGTFRTSHKSHGVRDVLVMHPGNPGVVHFYDDFALEVMRRCPHLAVIVLGFAGHTVENMNGDAVFDLQDQIEVADSFLRRAIRSANFRHVFVGGHSIGAHLALHMTARFAFVTKGLLLTPTIMRMKQSPNGTTKDKFLRKPVIALASGFLAPALNILPRPMKMILMRVAEPDMNARHSRVVMGMAKPNLVRNVLLLASTEFAQIADFDVPLLQSVQDRVWAYFVHSDGWVPLADMGRIHAEVPGVATYLETDRDVKHAWCCHAPEMVADAIHGDVTRHHA